MNAPAVDVAGPAAPAAEAAGRPAAARVHVVGAGIAGLACAVRLARAGRPVLVYDAAGQAGGRCRSYFDDRLERLIDNGNHVLLSANAAALAYLEEIGARHTLSAPPGAAYPFLDLTSGERWTLRPGAGPLPWWILARRRRVPGAGPSSYLRALRLGLAGPQATVADCLRRPGDALWPRLWEPLAVALLNTEAEAASARLFGRTLGWSFARGAEGCRLLTALTSLAETFVEPALQTLQQAGAEVRLKHRLRRLETEAGRVAALDFGRRRVELAPDERVVLAVPPAIAEDLLPGLEVPRASRAIVNAHIRLPHRARLPEGIPYLGLVGGTAQWLFLRQDVASLTVSAADDLADRPAGEIARLLWRDTAHALSLDARHRPPMRVIKEKRATFAQTPAELARRPGTRSALANLLLAGDWTATGMPATIESAARSGHAAAAAALAEP